MAKYYVSYSTVASSGVYVEADDEDSAREKADKKFYEHEPWLCHQCQNGHGNYNVEDDLDREPAIDMGEWEPVDGDVTLVSRCARKDS